MKAILASAVVTFIASAASADDNEITPRVGAANVAGGTSSQFEYDCANRPFVYPYFRQKPGYDVVCKVAWEGQNLQAAAPNGLWSLWKIAREICVTRKGEIKGLAYECELRPISGGF